MKREGIMIAVLAFIIIGAFFWLESWRNQTLNKPYSLVMNVGEDAASDRLFTWQSGSKQGKSLIQYIEGNNLAVDWKAEKAATVEGTASVIGEDGQSRTVHKAALSALQPGKTYVYRVGDGTEKGWSKTNLFHTNEGAPTVDGFTFINVTDSQGETDEHFKLWGDTLKQAFRVAPEASFIIHNGDLTENPRDGKAWDAFFREAAPWLSSVPLMPVTGNHEEIDGDAEPFVSYFNVPANGASGSLAGTTYFFDYDDARFIMLNTESNIDGQTEWLEEALKENTRKWIVVSLHRGPYGGNQNKEIHKWIELFDRYEVDLVLQGHNHEYARSYPLRDGQIADGDDSLVRNRAGTIYVVINAAGQKLNKQKKDQFYHKVHVQTGKRMFAAIRISGDILTYQAYDVDGKLWDEFQLDRTAP